MLDDKPQQSIQIELKRKLILLSNSIYMKLAKFINAAVFWFSTSYVLKMHQNLCQIIYHKA